MQILILASEGGRARETFRVFAVNRCFGVLWPCSGPFQCSERAKMRDECSNNILDRGEAASACAGCFSTREAAWNLLDFVVYTVRGGGKFYLPQGRESAQRADQ